MSYSFEQCFIAIKQVQVLAWLSFKARVERHVLGVLWYLLDPILYFIVFIAIQGHFVTHNIIPAGFYVMTGIVISNIMRKSFSASAGSILSLGAYTKSLGVKPIILVSGKIIESFISFLIEFLLVMVLMLYYKISIINVCIAIPLVVILYLFIQGVAWAIASITAYIRDMENLVNISMYLLTIASPVFYIPKSGTALHVFNTYNPLAQFIDLFRQVLFKGVYDVNLVLSVSLYSVVVFIFGYWMIKRATFRIAEVS